MKVRRARPTDAKAIYRLICFYAAQGILLPRAEADIREGAKRFLVLADGEAIAGCVALESYALDLAEIRSLAVEPGICGRGLGARLLRAALAEARRRKIARLFAVTHSPEFFLRYGFATLTRWAIPQKIERDCCTCPKRRACRLVAVVANVLPERESLPVIETAVPPPPSP